MSNSVKNNGVSTVTNFLLFQVCWFACVYSAVQGLPLVGIAAVIASTGYQVSRRSTWKQDLAFLLVVTVFGTMVDLIPYKMGAFEFRDQSLCVLGYPLWMSAMWTNFGSVLRSSLAWLGEKPLVSILLGAIGGPLAYYGGAAMGAISIADNQVYAYGMIAITWGIVTPLLFIISGYLENKPDD